MIRMIGFDLDGTLADTFPVILPAFCQTVQHFTGRQIDDQEILATFGKNEQGMLADLLPDVPLAASSAVFYQAYQEAHARLRTPFPGILKLLAALEAHGIAVALITGKGQRSCEISLTQLGLNGVFAPILVGSPDHDVKTANLKKLLTMSHLAPSELAYVGDAVSDLQAAAAAGVHCYSAAWAPSAQPAQLVAAQADLYYSVAALQAVLVD
ncbi:HAD family hydrolase [Lacticaseibacillus jixianensis]|uniref:HAD family hydrolase n=1 Tax=Lacticaseibacillus jixianensis TaxID=2486012 RepID=A0ABW4B9B6_9LACO|nr:HAD hydrolase-like protein [Lacticaseibacillus jixianensis]